MPEIKSPGQLAYEGYFQKSGGKSVITSEPLPTWNAQIPALREAWEAAAAAVTRPSHVEAPKPTPEPQPLWNSAATQTGTAKPVNVPAKVEAPKDQFASYRAATEAKPQPITQTLPAKPVERPEPPKGPVSQPPLKPKTF